MRNNDSSTQTKWTGSQISIIEIECVTKIETTCLEFTTEKFLCSNEEIAHKSAEFWAC